MLADEMVSTYSSANRGKLKLCRTNGLSMLLLHLPKTQLTPALEQELNYYPPTPTLPPATDPPHDQHEASTSISPVSHTPTPILAAILLPVSRSLVSGAEPARTFTAGGEMLTLTLDVIHIQVVDLNNGPQKGEAKTHMPGERHVDCPGGLCEGKDKHVRSVNTLTSPHMADSRPAIVGRRAYRLWLSDSEYVVQALLRRELHALLHDGRVLIEKGDVMQVRAEVRKGRRMDGSQKELLYLAVNEILGVWRGGVRKYECGMSIDENQRTVEESTVHAAKEKSNEDRGSPTEEMGLNLQRQTGEGSRPPVDVSSDTENERKRTRNDDQGQEEPMNGIRGNKSHAAPLLDESTSSTTFQNSSSAAVSILPTSNACSSAKLSTSHTAPIVPLPTAASSTNPLPPVSNPPVPLASSTPLPAPPVLQKPASPFPSGPITPSHLHGPQVTTNLNQNFTIWPLASLLRPPRPLPRRNFRVDIFAVVTWLSPVVIRRPNMPPKRDLRVLDLSLVDSDGGDGAYQDEGQDQGHGQDNINMLLSSRPPPRLRDPRGVSMSVFVDASHFTPRVGTVALFRGLRTHEWEGVSLNAYSKDCAGMKWFVADEKSLKEMALDVEGLRRLAGSWEKGDIGTREQR